MQRSRKLNSSSAPGGRMRARLSSAARPGVLRNTGSSAAPAARLVRTRRRSRSGPSRVVLVSGKKRKASPLSGHSATQFMHRWHSAWRQRTPGIGSSPPWQLSWQRLQSVHWLSRFSKPRIDQRESHSQQRAQRAQRPAPEAREAQVQDENCGENEPDRHPLPEVGLAEVQQRVLEKEMQRRADVTQRFPARSATARPQSS